MRHYSKNPLHIMLVNDVHSKDLQRTEPDNHLLNK